MSLRIVIVGPGRVGSALGHCLAQRGVQVLGYIGRDAARTSAAVRFCGMGSVLQWADLVRAHVVLFTVGDAELKDAVAAAMVAVPPRACSLWLHTSGRHDLSVFDAALSHGIRRASLHPIAPFPDAQAGVRGLMGAPALLDGDARSQRLLRRLCTWLGLVPIAGLPGDRALYHAACALAANGLTALHGVVARVLAGAGVVPTDAQALVIQALMGSALQASSNCGAAKALSGPVRRGDVDTVLAHLEALRRAVPDAVDVYGTLMAQAVLLATSQGLAAVPAAAMRRVLARPSNHPADQQPS